MTESKMTRKATVGFLSILTVLLLMLPVIDANSQGRENWKRDRQQARDSTWRAPRMRQKRSARPNIVFVLTDDQDVLLGSMKAMPKTRRFLRDQGADFSNTFTTTPMCCPSRSSILTGLYAHNHDVYTNNYNCSSPQWQETHEKKSFATYLQNTGYKTGYFGKYLNEYNGSYIPPGWGEWVGLIRNSRFYNYTINFNGQKIKHSDNYYKDYLTDLIANDSVTFLKQSKRHFPDKPVMMVLSVPAPHGPEDAAPQYQHMFVNNTDHHTGSYNQAPNKDKQWLLQVTEKMTPILKKFTDLLQRRRLQTLQSVDDLVEKVCTELDMLGELENTYILYTSDHGYHLGQFGLVKGKAMPYDFDTRIPFFIRGPGIKPKTKISNIVANIDIAPTILDMAGIAVPDDMDGRSVLRLLKTAAKDHTESDSGGFVATRKLWRDTILLERGKVTMKQLKMRLRKEKQQFIEKSSHDDGHLFFLTKKQRKMSRICSQLNHQAPCKPDQKNYCLKDKKGRMRIQKCHQSTALAVLQNDQPGCSCPKKKKHFGRRERKKQIKFWKRHTGRRDRRSENIRMRRSLDNLVSFGSAQSGSPPLSLRRLGLFQHRCRVLPNNTISCDHELYSNVNAWKDHKDRIDEKIKEYRKALEDLRDIRRHLKDLKPENELSLFEDRDQLLPPFTGPLLETNKDCDCDVNTIPNSFGSENPSSGSRKKLRKKKKRKKQRRKRRKYQDKCNEPNMKCFHHDDNHWQTPPYWNYGPFCFCPNSNNNTYWCLRTVNQTHNFLYCEFITNFISYYDMVKDPYQLHNAVQDLNYGILQQLHDQLGLLRKCKGGRECTMRGGQRPVDKSWGRIRELPSSGDGDNETAMWETKLDYEQDFQ